VRDVLELPPGEIVGIHELGKLAVLVLVVAEREHGRGREVEDEVRRLHVRLGRLTLLGDIAGRRDHGVASGSSMRCTCASFACVLPAIRVRRCEGDDGESDRDQDERSDDPRT
jgi:hypothetical protein